MTSMTSYSANPMGSANQVPQGTLIDFGVKFLLTEGVERQWKIPFLYNELRKIRGEDHQMHIEAYAHLAKFEYELQCVLDEIIPDYYTFTVDGKNWHTWAYLTQEYDDSVERNDGADGDINSNSDWDSSEDSDGWSDDDY